MHPGGVLDTPEASSVISGTSDLEGASGKVGSGKKDKRKSGRFFSLFSSKEKLGSAEKPDAPGAGTAAAAAAALPVAAVTGAALAADSPDADVSVDSPAVDVPALGGSQDLPVPSGDIPSAPTRALSTYMFVNFHFRLLLNVPSERTVQVVRM